MKSLSKLTLALLPTLAMGAGSAYAATDAFNPAQKKQIQEIVHEYLVQKPEVIVEALQVIQRKQFDEAQQNIKDTQKNAIKFAAALFNQANDPVVGNPAGKITIVEFFDYQCPHCVTMAPVLESIVKANPEVRIVYKEFPIRGPMSETAAKAALAANKQGKYKVLSHALLTNTQPLSEEVIFNLAKKSGVDVEKLKKDMSDDSINKQLQANMKLAQDLKLFGTPAFFIGKTDVKSVKEIQYAPGEMNVKQLQEAIDKA